MKLQWQTSRAYIIWSVCKDIFLGLQPLAFSYIFALIVADVGRIALQSADIAATGIYTNLLLILALLLVREAVDAFDYPVRSRFSMKLEAEATDVLINRIYRLSQEQFDDQVFSAKVERARESVKFFYRLPRTISRALSALIGMVGILVAVIIYSPWLGLLALGLLVPATLLHIKANHIFERSYEKTAADYRVARHLSWKMFEPREMAEVRLMNSFKRIASIWRSRMTDITNRRWSDEKKMAGLYAAAGIVQPAIVVAATVHYVGLVARGALSLESFIFLRDILDRFSRNIRVMVGELADLHSSHLDLQKFNEISNAQPAIPNGSVTIKPPLTLSLSDVNFSYATDGQFALRDINLTIRPGEKLAIVGRNGSGKTTLLKLILRQYLPSKGRITVNGTGTGDLEAAGYYNLVGNLSQEFMLFDYLSIRDNLTAGLEYEPSDEKIYSAARLAKAEEIIKSLPEQLDTRMSPSFYDGSSFSGGERQRLAIARTLLRDSNLIILDEPTSSIDAKAEYEIFNNIYEACTDKTVLIVSHRFSTVRQADKIVVLKEGRISETGSHEELLANNGLYKEMFELQATGYS